MDRDNNRDCKRKLVTIVQRFNNKKEVVIKDGKIFRRRN